MQRQLLLLPILLLLACHVHAQWNSVFLGFTGDEVDLEGDSMQIVQGIKNYRLEAIREGYINTSLDGIEIDSPKINPQFYFGRTYENVDIILDSKTLLLVNQASRGERAWRGLSLNESEIGDAMRDIITHLEHTGYPFASAKLDSIQVDTSSIKAKLNISKGPFIQFDSIALGKQNLVNEGFLYRYLNISPGSPYNSSVIFDLQKKLNNLSFVQLDGEPSVTFLNNEAILNLPLKEKKASRFDFIFGIVPNDNSESDQRYTLTGEFLSEMVNRLGRGERMFVNLRRLRPEVLEVKLAFDYPYIFSQPLGIESSFALYRNSTDFLDVSAKAGLQFILSGNDQIGVTVSNTSSRLIQIDSTSILNSRRLPSKQDFSFTSGGLGLTFNHLDYRFNPTKGWSIRSSLNLGVKTIIKNRSIEQLNNEFVDFETAYDTIDLQTFQTEAQLYADLFLPPNTWSTVKLSVDGGYKYNQDRLYDNELWRIGGNRRLRGFEEESILTDFFLVGTAEYRILLDKNSFLALPIIDYGRYRFTQAGVQKWDTALSVGLGLNFATAAGVFNVSFVAGSRLNNPVNLQETKIHFGYVNLF